MKQKLLPKYLIAAVLAFSLFSFAYVNLHSAYTTHSTCEQKVENPQPVLIEDDEDNANKIPVPDVTIISRVLDIIQRYAASQ